MTTATPLALPARVPERVGGEIPAMKFSCFVLYYRSPNTQFGRRVESATNASTHLSHTLTELVI